MPDDTLMEDLEQAISELLDAASDCPNDMHASCGSCRASCAMLPGMVKLLSRCLAQVKRGMMNDDSGLDGAIELLDSHVMPKLRRCLAVISAKECAYGHRSRVTGCVSCVLVFDRQMPEIATLSAEEPTMTETRAASAPAIERFVARAYIYEYSGIDGRAWVVGSSGPWNGQMPTRGEVLYVDVRAALAAAEQRAQALREAIQEYIAASDARRALNCGPDGPVFAEYTDLKAANLRREAAEANLRAALTQETPR